ncbi:MAG: hypothetical protein ABIF19_10920, partial [Planctomycetota bacterium]
MKKFKPRSNTLLTNAALVFALIALACTTASAAELNQPPKGFVALFNGTDLAGWKGLLKGPYDNPSKRATLAPDQLKDLQKQADEDMRAHW